MLRTRIPALLAAVMTVVMLCAPAFAAEVDCDSAYCFSAADFSVENGELAGICITQLPDSAAGTVMLGSRVVQPGDILTAEQVAQMTFAPRMTQTDAVATVSYLPIYPDHVAASATMTLAIRGKTDQPPVAEDFAMETYKNLPNDGRLKVNDPEGQALTYTVTRQPKRGTVDIRADGSFTYTPKKNKVGVDSFSFTAADPAGNVSREATVTIQILKPTDASQYTDTVGRGCRFAAEWMRNTGLFVGEQISGESCFFPDQSVSRGEFLAMLTKCLHLPADAQESAADANAPDWLKPYLAAAERAGLTANLPGQDAESWHSEAVTGAEAAVMLQNALDLTVSASTVEEAANVPAWAAQAVTAMAENGVMLTPDKPLTREQAAMALYQANCLAASAPGAQLLEIAANAEK